MALEVETGTYLYIRQLQLGNCSNHPIPECQLWHLHLKDTQDLLDVRVTTCICSLD